MPVTMKDVARQAGVSTATVSYVLNGKTAAIKEETCQRVLDAVAQLGYTRNVTAQNLRQQRTGMIGFAWSEKPRDVPNAVLDIFAYHLTRIAAGHGYRMLMFTHAAADPVPSYDALISTRRVDGFLLADTTQDDLRIHHLIECGVPFVAFGRSNPDWAFNWIDTDSRAGTLDAARYLIRIGHRRIAMLSWPADSFSGEFRAQGYRQALDEAGIAFDPALLVRTTQSVTAAASAIAPLLALPAVHRPTAIIAVSDLIAVGAMDAARAAGLVVGRDLSIIGFDDEPMSQYLTPPLTTLAQPLEEIAGHMVAILDDLLTGTGGALHQMLIPPRLVVRASTAPPP
jgi:DNA-binding LacI/PurR family transcriptional regulator